MKLNNKGYLLVEIIVAFTIAMTMAYFLIEIVIDIKNINEDYYVDTKLETDQILITKNIMQDISNYTLKEIEVKNQKQIDFTFNNLDNSTFKTRLNLDIDNKKFQYGKLNGNEYIKNTLFTKTLDSKLNYETPNISKLCLKDNNYEDCDTLSDINDITDFMLSIKYKATTIYSDKDYGININIPYKKEKEIEIKIYNPCTKDPLTINCTNGAICETTNDNRIVKILSSGDIELEPGYNCKEKELGIALVGGGDGGKTGTIGPDTGTGGDGGNGGNGGKVIIKNNYSINLEKYKIVVGNGGKTDSTGEDSFIKKINNTNMLTSISAPEKKIGGTGATRKDDKVAENGTDGNDIVFNNVVQLYDKFGSSGGGGGAGCNFNCGGGGFGCNNSSGRNGGINAGSGKYGTYQECADVADRTYASDYIKNSNGIENTGSGGGGGNGAHGTRFNIQNDNYPGGEGGSGIVILYNELGFNVNSGNDIDYALDNAYELAKSTTLYHDTFYKCPNDGRSCFGEITDDILESDEFMKYYNIEKIYIGKLRNHIIDKNASNNDLNLITNNNQLNAFVDEFKDKGINTTSEKFKYKIKKGTDSWGECEYIIIIELSEENKQTKYDIDFAINKIYNLYYTSEIRNCAKAGNNLCLEELTSEVIKDRKIINKIDIENERIVNKVKTVFNISSIYIGPLRAYTYTAIEKDNNYEETFKTYLNNVINTNGNYTADGYQHKIVEIDNMNFFLIAKIEENNSGITYIW